MDPYKNFVNKKIGGITMVNETFQKFWEVILLRELKPQKEEIYFFNIKYCKDMSN